jgi:Ni,Fe-hydrogenase III large subunit
MVNLLVLFLVGIGEPVEGHEPFGRVHVDRDGWLTLLGAMAGNAGWTLAGLWADGQTVFMALREEMTGDVVVVSLDCPDGTYPAVSPVRASASRPERTIRDLNGLVAEGAIDERPWLDHGHWNLRHPLGAAEAAEPAPVVYPFLPSEGPGLHQIPVGPVHAGIIEPGHFRFTANGECVVRLEERLGYVHKGIERLFQGRLPEDAAPLAARISGDSTVAHSLAFARAVEAALEIDAPERAVWLRALMAELERLANHLGDIGAVANDAAFAFLLAELSQLREAVLRAADTCFGHRLMMDRVVPGGVSADIHASGPFLLLDLTAELRPRFRRLADVYDERASLKDRTATTGIVPPGLINRFGAGGFVGRAAGRGHDARRSPSYPPYDDLEFEVPVLTESDVDARVRIRIDEVWQSLSLIEQIVRRLPGRPKGAEGRLEVPRIPLPRAAGQGIALVESFRGEIMTWVRLDGEGKVARCHPRDPSWFQWPLLENAIHNNIVADFPLCNKSFNGSYSGHDL